ncbi:cytosolic phospholipase A2 gamma [Eublepharis macularius]|uniref:Cytosolic phospholipase A2 gamma n=1 Tax=Eublepharis macularius TaxID=481883 RepID=A0AA97LAN6_EUBMA|nr:cytosolic phospholipase A2 gamma [Eublepharis macularius]
MDRNGSEKVKVRLSKSLSEGEKASIAFRKEEVKKGLAKLGIPSDVNKTPNIAVLGSGGALRAMIALYGTLVELKKHNLLDCITYLAGVSGSTWCMSTIYKHGNWTEKIESLEKLQIEKLSQNKWNVKEATSAVADAANEENYSLTDIWSYLIVHQLLNELDETELSSHTATSERGKTPYPIYAAVDKNTYNKQHEGTWFEFTPHEVGVPGLGAYVDLSLFGSVFENGQLLEEKKEKNICYLQGLWGSALGSEREIYESIKDSLGLFPNQDRSRAGDTWDYQVVSTFYQAYQCIVELHLRVVDGKEVDAIFDQLEKLLNTPKTKRSYEMTQKMRKTWSSSDATKRKNDCIALGKALEKDFGVLDMILGKPLEIIKESKVLEKPLEVIKDNKVVDKIVDNVEKPVEVIADKVVDKVVDKPLETIKNGSQAISSAISSGSKRIGQLIPRGKPPSEQPTEAASAGYRVLRFLNVVRKTYSCLLTWTWGTINNFLYKCSGVDSPALTEEPVISLIDAGLAINTPYPLILHPERNVKLILSFDFSSGDPFETLKKTVDYCKTHGIPFPRIDEKELNDTENPTDCYIFRGDNGLTVMHFPLFNKVNCPEKIAEYRDQFSTFKRNYTREEIEKLILAAKKNVINVRQKIVEEIKRTVGSQRA